MKKQIILTLALAITTIINAQMTKNDAMEIFEDGKTESIEVFSSYPLAFISWNKEKVTVYEENSRNQWEVRNSTTYTTKIYGTLKIMEGGIKIGSIYIPYKSITLFDTDYNRMVLKTN